ncbi:energy transducer TonB [Lignipirellula cremea]|uniref:Gram-negative bacterial tonB protein n=1 Tax=Lignipirellula cremea TaxID=2528010 RepID=A0A518E565_9BACT|nr:energy transducer TonB [Lignipirellula cremea]QDU99221.1 Gram-negative bacterial tonB protein [Lignipirellula cremea]
MNYPFKLALALATSSALHATFIAGAVLWRMGQIEGLRSPGEGVPALAVFYANQQPAEVSVLPPPIQILAGSGAGIAGTGPLVSRDISLDNAALEWSQASASAAPPPQRPSIATAARNPRNLLPQIVQRDALGRREAAPTDWSAAPPADLLPRSVLQVRLVSNQQITALPAIRLAIPHRPRTQSPSQNVALLHIDRQTAPLPADLAALSPGANIPELEAAPQRAVSVQVAQGPQAVELREAGSMPLPPTPRNTPTGGESGRTVRQGLLPIELSVDPVRIWRSRPRPVAIEKTPEPEIEPQEENLHMFLNGRRERRVLLSPETLDAMPQPHPANPLPAFPPPELHQGRSGVCWVEVRLSNQGAVEGARVGLSSGNEAFDRAAVAAVSHWRYRPAIVSRNPVACVFYERIWFDVR